jgi:hypothetical protein
MPCPEKYVSRQTKYVFECTEMYTVKSMTSMYQDKLLQTHTSIYVYKPGTYRYVQMYKYKPGPYQTNVSLRENYRDLKESYLLPNS